VQGAAFGAFGPSMMLLWERIAPSHAQKGGFASVMRLSCTIGVGGGFLWFYNRSIRGLCPTTFCFVWNLISRTERFYGMTENKREIEMDMREMVDKVKKHEPLYGKSTLTPYMQGVASRNSRYAGIWLHVIPWFNFVNHDQVSYANIITEVLTWLTFSSTVLILPNTTYKRKRNWLQRKQRGRRAHRYILGVPMVSNHIEIP